MSLHFVYFFKLFFFLNSIQLEKRKEISFINLFFLAKLFIPTIKLASGPINQTTAASQCRTLFDSQLIPRKYVEDHNLTGNTIQELNPGASAWLMGKHKTQAAIKVLIINVTNIKRKLTSYLIKHKTKTFLSFSEKCLRINDASTKLHETAFHLW